jgi:hypothetical protein
MSLAGRDIQRIADAVAERFDRDPPQGIVDAVYKKLDENALTDIRDRLDRIEADISSMAEDMAKIPQIEGEMRVMNENMTTLLTHAGT